jgi:hypothetical protein
VSGQLASWVAEHSAASYRGVAVLNQYALAANHDGTPATDVTRDDLVRRTRLGKQTVIAGRQEVIKRKELEELEAPGGRGKPGRFRVVVALCPDGVRCWSCDALAKAMKRRRPKGETVRSADGFEEGPSTETVRSADGFGGGGEPRKGPSQTRKGPPRGPTTVTVPTGLVGSGVRGAPRRADGQSADPASTAAGGRVQLPAAPSLRRDVSAAGLRASGRGASSDGSSTTTVADEHVHSSTTVALEARSDRARPPPTAPDQEQNAWKERSA